MSQSVWNLCASSLQDELPAQQFNTWIKPLQIESTSVPGELCLVAPNRFICNWVEEKFLVRIRELVNHFQGNQDAVAVSIKVGAQSKPLFQSSVAQGRVAQVDASEFPYKSSKPLDDASVLSSSAPEVKVYQKAEVEGALKHSNYLNAGYTFTSFVEGKSNQLGLAAARQVAENPGGSFYTLLSWFL